MSNQHDSDDPRKGTLENELAFDDEELDGWGEQLDPNPVAPEEQPGQLVPPPGTSEWDAVELQPPDVQPRTTSPFPAAQREAAAPPPTPVAGGAGAMASDPRGEVFTGEEQEAFGDFAQDAEEDLGEYYDADDSTLAQIDEHASEAEEPIAAEGGLQTIETDPGAEQAGLEELAGEPAPAAAPAPAPRAAEEAPRGTLIDALPLTDAPPADRDSWLTNFKFFKAETQKLARVGNWRRLAAITGHALNNAPFATRMTRTAMLLDLAQLYRDRLRDARRAEETFAVLAQEEPSSSEALTYLTKVYEERSEWGAIYDLYVAAVEATWDPNERLSWTRRAADLAAEQMGQIDLAIRAWEHLWHLGDAVDAAARALTRFYRKAGRWADMAAFLRQQAERLEGPTELVVLRELAEVLLSGLKAPTEASEVLEQIVERSPQDAIATLQLARVYAQREEWAALERLGHQAAEDATVSAALDLQHLVADALWQAGRHQQAVAAYERILDADPTNHDGLKRKREYLTQQKRWPELLVLLEERVDAAESDDDRVALLGEAAELAEKELGKADQAVKLWESFVAIAPERPEGYVALARLYEQLGDLQGIARAIEGQLKLAREQPERIVLLRRLGDHYARRLDEDDRAEECWKRILALDPSDLPTRKELTELHRRRGDFEALNSSLMRQIWLTTDEERAETLCRMAAENLDQNFEDPGRSVEAWRRVLDFKPLDRQALEQLTEHYAKLDNKRELIAVLEQRIRSVHLTEERIKLALQVARLWELEEVPRAAAATYERVLRWDPTHAEGLTALVRIYKENKQQGKALGALDHAASLVEQRRRVELAREQLGLIAEDDHFARFFQLRRILFVSAGDPAVLEELFAEAKKADLWPEMAAVVVQLACQQEDDEERIDLQADLSRIYEEQLAKPALAYLTQQAALLSPEHRDAVIEDLDRLARVTERFEDLLVVLDRLTTPEFELGERKAVLQRRAELCENDLADPLRAFHEHRRRIELDPSDWAPLEDLQRLAAGHELWRQLDAVFAELWDRIDDNDPSARRRLELLNRRESVARLHLKQQARAFDFLARRYRLDDGDLELLRALTQDAEELDAWAWLLPLLEAAQRAPVDQSSTDELIVTAALYEEKLKDHDRAFALYREVFVLDPRTKDVLGRLEVLAETTSSHEQLADALRMAAASSDDQDLTLDLLRRIAAIYEEKLKSPARAIDIHRRLLDLKDDEQRSLEVMIDWHREHSEHRDLRDRLQQWCELAPEQEDRLPKLLEIARVSQERLLDAEEALSAFGRVLELAPDHEEAKAGLEGLVSSITEPGLRKRWLQMQLAGAEGERAATLRLEIAKILEEDLEDVGGAITELKTLVETDGADGVGFAPLARLLEQRGRHEDRVLLLQARAEALEDVEEKLAALDEAVALCHEQLADTHQELREQLYRAILDNRPTDHDVRVRLARLLRESGRFEDLSQLIEAQLEHMTPPRQVAMLYELGRIGLLNLEKPEPALAYFERISELAPDEEGALLARASFARKTGDLPAYLTLRHEQTKHLGPIEAALVLCHLAEICDENASIKAKMVGYYREARGLDPDNVPAMEALKGIGRRLKTLRPAAALLPLEGERELESEERAQRLKSLGDGAMATNPKTALDWYRRAVAVDPDTPEHWAALAAVLIRSGDLASAYRARRGWMQALARSEPLDPKALKLEARRLYELASAAKAADRLDDHAQLVQQAFELVPSFAPAALARAQAQLEMNDIDGAHALLHEVLEHHPADLNEEQQMTAFYCRGVARRALGEREKAREDFRATLALSPLHADCLVAMGELQAELGHIAAALEHQIRALTVVEDPQARARLYYRIGVLWEDGLQRLDEAGACYEMALGEGVDERDLLHRALRHYKRTGRLDQSLDVVEGLLPTAEEPEELATLWLVRGEILAAREGAEDEAIEAFDMALSYDPGRQAARDGLTLVLERRGDWNQLLQVLEASADAGKPAQRAKALMRMADISAMQLGDPLRAEEYLRQSVAAHPTREALLELEGICGADPSREAEHKEILGMLVAFGPPWFERCLELGKRLLSEDQHRAWVLLSPLLGVSQIDADIKAVVQAMRKEFERPPLRAPAEGSYDLLRHPDALLEIGMVLTELAELVPEIGVATLKDAGDGSAITVGANTSLGKTFAALAEASGLPECTLHRTQTLPEAVVVVNEEDAPRVVVRTDVMQQLVHAEVGFLFAYALELAQPANRLLASLPPTMRDYLLPALWHVIGFTSSISPAAAALAGQISEASDDAARERWAQTLAPLAKSEPLQLAQKYWQGTLATARRAGLLAGADTRQVFRVIARMEEDVPRPRVVAKLEELDEYVGQSALLQDIIAYAASPAFGQLLADAVIVAVE